MGGGGGSEMPSTGNRHVAVWILFSWRERESKKKFFFINNWQNIFFLSNLKRNTQDRRMKRYLHAHTHAHKTGRIVIAFVTLKRERDFIISYCVFFTFSHLYYVLLLSQTKMAAISITENRSQHTRSLLRSKVILFWWCDSSACVL